MSCECKITSPCCDPCSGAQGTSTPGNDILGPSIVDRHVPLSNGFNIPLLGVIRGYDRYFTRCLYLNQSAIPDPVIHPTLQVSKTEFEFGYYNDEQTIDVQAYPKPTLQFASSAKVQTFDNVTRVYLGTSPDYYIDFTYTQDSFENEIYTGHYDVMVSGYDNAEAQGFTLPFEITAGPLSVSATVEMKAPFIELSSMTVNLREQNDNTQDVTLASNVGWHFDFT